LTIALLWFSLLRDAFAPFHCARVVRIRVRSRVRRSPDAGRLRSELDGLLVAAAAELMRERAKYVLPDNTVEAPI